MNRKVLLVFLALFFLNQTPCPAISRGLFLGSSLYYKRDDQGNFIKKNGKNVIDDSLTLVTADNDASDMQRVMMRERVIERDNADQNLLIQDRNNKTMVLNALKRVVSDLGNNDTLFLYNSSHGETIGAFEVKDGTITDKDVQEILANSSVGNVIIMNESCFSDAFRVKIPGRNIVHINSSLANKPSESISLFRRENANKGNGPMTRWLINGLDEFNADLNGDGELTCRELVGFVGMGLATDVRDLTLNMYKYDEIDVDMVMDAIKQGVNMRGPDLKMPDIQLQDDETTDASQGQQGSETADLADPAADPDDQTAEPQTARTMVPSLMGIPKGQAISELVELGLGVKTETLIEPDEKQFIPADFAGTVAATLPESGTMVATGTQIEMAVYPTHVVSVPDVMQRPVSEATHVIQDAALKPAVISTIGLGLFTPAVSAGSGADSADETVITWMEPEPGNQVVAGSSITLYTGAPDAVRVPDVVGLYQHQAERKMEAAGLKTAITIAPRKDLFLRLGPGKYAGCVVTSEPQGGAECKKGSTVKLTVYPDEVAAIPNLEGRREAEVAGKLNDRGLKFEKWTEFSRSSSHEPRNAYFWEPQGATFPGDTVRVAFENPAVPHLIGMRAAQARTACSLAHLKSNFGTAPLAPDGSVIGKVIAQQPRAGTVLAAGSMVTCQMSEYQKTLIAEESGSFSMVHYKVPIVEEVDPERYQVQFPAMVPHDGNLVVELTLTITDPNWCKPFPQTTGDGKWRCLIISTSDGRQRQEPLTLSYDSGFAVKKNIGITFTIQNQCYLQENNSSIIVNHIFPAANYTFKAYVEKR